jgi:cytochrome c-type biogenesis protein CcmH
VKAVVLVVVALALAAPAAASERHPTLGELEGQLMCPICAGETLAQSDSPAAQRIKAYIQRRIEQGATRSQIKKELVAEWGTKILAAPPRHGFDLLAWVLPLVGLLGGAVMIGGLAWRWSRTREEQPAGPLPPYALNGRPLEPDLERRLDEELARFDG